MTKILFGLPAMEQYQATSLTTYHEQGELERDHQCPSEQTHRLTRLTIKFPGPGRTVLIRKEQVRLESAYETTLASLKQAQVLTLAMLSGERESSRLAAHSSPLWALVTSVAMPRVSRILMSPHGVS